MEEETKATQDRETRKGKRGKRKEKRKERREGRGEDEERRGRRGKGKGRTRKESSFGDAVMTHSSLFSCCELTEHGHERESSA